MKIILQRVKYSSVTVANKSVAKINHGFNLLVGFSNQDKSDLFPAIINKIINLRVFEDESLKMNKSILDIDGEILVVSQFTLYANTNSGRRPSFDKAAKADVAKKLFQEFVEMLAKSVKVKTGIFGAEMEVEIVNDGPVTIISDSEQK